MALFLLAIRVLLLSEGLKPGDYVLQSYLRVATDLSKRSTRDFAVENRKRSELVSSVLAYLWWGGGRFVCVCVGGGLLLILICVSRQA